MKLPVKMFPVSPQALKPVAFVLGALAIMAAAAKKREQAKTQNKTN